MDSRSPLIGLQRVAEEVAAQWGVALGQPFALSRHSFVAPAGDAVLKVTPRDDDESDEEVDALMFWDGDGAARLIRQDRGRRAMLMKRAVPGSDISELPENEATEVAVEVGLRLWRPAAEPFRWIGNHVPRWLENAEFSGQPADDLLQVARRTLESLTPGSSTLIHGDFHHHNLVQDGDSYVAIDPKPMLGDPEFDVPSFLWNPIRSSMTRERTEKRLATFASAGLDEGLMRAWTVIRGAYLVPDEAKRQLIKTLV